MEGEVRCDLPGIYAFRQALRKAMWYELWQGWRHQPADLLPFNVVANELHLYQRVPLGIQQVPCRAIVGSVDRAGDFTRNFLPRKEYLQARWCRIHALLNTQGFDPISLFKVSEIYFVHDGNHRLSVLNWFRTPTVEADVIEYPCRVPLGPDLQIADLPCKAAYVEFLEQTDLDWERPEQRIELSQPASYRKLEEHIAGHAYWLEHCQGEPVSVHRAAVSWYDRVYMPTIALIRSRGLLRDFPGSTEADLYIELMDYYCQLVREVGRPVPLEAVLEHYRMTAARPKIRRLWHRLRRRNRYHLGATPVAPLAPLEHRLANPQ